MKLTLLVVELLTSSAERDVRPHLAVADLLQNKLVVGRDRLNGPLAIMSLGQLQESVMRLFQKTLFSMA